jgi:hypothetical protein
MLGVYKCEDIMAAVLARTNAVRIAPIFGVLSVFNFTHRQRLSLYRFNDRKFFADTIEV